VKQIFIDDLREEFVKDFVFPMFRGNGLYEGIYLLGTSIARPLIAKRQIEIAEECGADAVSHGATGKGNDQIRFEVGYYALKPDVKVIAPWREWDLNSRTRLIAYAEDAGIKVPENKKGGAPLASASALIAVQAWLLVHKVGRAWFVCTSTAGRTHCLRSRRQPVAGRFFTPSCSVLSLVCVHLT
jgi:argininosuccinate synthase